MPSAECEPIHPARFGVKNAGMPRVMVVRLADRLDSPVQNVSGSCADPCSMRPQKSRNRASRFSLALPAMSAALIAPIDVPITQSGSMPASCNAS